MFVEADDLDPEDERLRLLAGGLSLLMPGLGHLYAGHPKTALAWVFAWPLFVGTIAVGIATGVVPGLAFTGLVLVWLAYRMLAMFMAIAAVEPDAPYAMKRYNRVGVYVAFFAGALFVNQAATEVIQTFVVEVVRVSSASMAPALLPGDQILVIKRPFAGPPQRGDVVMFRRNSGEAALRRVAALPGETVAFDHGLLFVDGRQLTSPPAGPATVVDSQCRETAVVTHDEGAWVTYTEANPRIQNTSIASPLKDGYVYLVGDYRAHSRVGPVAADKILGRAVVVVASWWPACGGGPKVERMGIAP